EPRWLQTKSDEARNRGTVIVAFKDQASADQLIRMEKAICLGSVVFLQRFEEHVLKECGRCGSLEHFSSGCPAKTICKLCGANDHHAGNHPKGHPVKCINCRGDHASTEPTCP
ncbi:hypothetical protein DL93DRAFT_2047125, partial [Clavulina sp. PMI_390]